MSTVLSAHPRRILIVSTIVLALGLTALDRNLLAAVWPAVQIQLKSNNAQYGILVAGFSLSYGLCAPLMGYLLDRFGVNRVAITAIAVWSLSGIATAFASSFSALLLCRIVLGCAESAALPSAGKTYATYLSPSERSLGTAATQIGLTLGSIAATLLAGVLTVRYGWQSVFWVAGPLGFVWIPLWLWISTGEKSPSSNTEVTSSKKTGATVALLARPGVWALVAASLLTMPLYSLWTNWTTVYLVRERGLSMSAANLHVAWIPPFFACLGGISGGWFPMHLTRRGMPFQKARFLVCLWAAMLLLSTATIPTLSSVRWVTVGIDLSFFLTLCISVNIYAMALDLFGTDHAGFVFSLLTAIYGLMQTAISPLIGLWIDHHNFHAVCIIGSVTPICGVGVLYQTVFRKGNRVWLDAKSELRATASLDA